MTAAKTLCLNMIVKNERTNLERCLAAVVDHIDCWVIGDTGSTDGTQDFIKSYFSARGKPGELHSFPFHNFEQARNAALDCAAGAKLDYDYLLLADADMELVVEDREFKTRLEAPGYCLIQRTVSEFSYWNTRILRRNIGARYVGVTHEYLDVPGGTKNLHEAWYKDHACGSNRVDKFERDARLLREGLEKEPDNKRYWFYLAQSYRDAGRGQEAAEAYAKRAEMGGWDEEAWYARMQEARCLLALKDDAGFLRQALVAFNQRPSRAEPLYDLAKYYRERGMNDASVIFSEPYLEMKQPAQDILFLESFVYTTGMREEYSIAANYSRDPVRKDRGHAVCESLALDRNVTTRSRDLARGNLFFYVRPVKDLMPSFASRKVDFSPPVGWKATAPSIARDGNAIVMVLECVRQAGSGESSDNSPASTRNFFLRLNEDLLAVSAIEILPPTDFPSQASPDARGFENCRLFAWQGGNWCVSKVRNRLAEGGYKQVLARVNDSEGGPYHFADWRALDPEEPKANDTNWMPFVEHDTLRFISACDPTRIIDGRGKTFAESVPAIAADTFHGGAQAISFDDGWLTLIHEKDGRDGKAVYWHRFAWFDASFVLRKASRRFYFREKEVESATGLTWHPDGKRLLVSYGTCDNQTWVGSVEAGDVRQAMAEATVFMSTTAIGKVAFTRPMAKEDRSAEQVARDTPPQFPPSSIINVGNWIPDKPAAGTEIMEAELRRRLGDDLNRINLKVNDPEHDTLDERPRVVWIHHDVNQQWVQWCKDEEVTKSVDCFVFVTDWQREQYLNTFNLPIERTQVLRHALDLDQTARCWEHTPILRCAYTSTPFRGLSVLLDAWEGLSPSNAELHIWSSMKLYTEDDAPYRHLFDRAKSMSGVIYHGLAQNRELRAALREMHFLVYPCTFRETACLAAIEAMAAGCRLIMPSLGALPETTAGFARIYPIVPDEHDHATIFSELLNSELRNPWLGKPEQSLKQQIYCSESYNWPQRLQQWRQLIDDLCAEKRAKNRG